MHSGYRRFIFLQVLWIGKCNLVERWARLVSDHGSRDAFIQRFKLYADSSYVPATLTANEVNTQMPWTMYTHMTDQDLGAVYDYLASVKPMKNIVVKIALNKK